MKRLWLGFLAMLLVCAVMVGALAEGISIDADAATAEDTYEWVQPEEAQEAEIELELGGDIPAEEPAEDEPEQAEEPSVAEAFEGLATLDDLTLAVNAEAGVFLPGALLSMALADDEAFEEAAAALAPGAVVLHTVFDVLVTDASGNESLPDTAIGMPVATLTGLPLASIREAYPGAEVQIQAVLKDAFNDDIRLVNTWTADDAVCFELSDCARFDIMVAVVDPEQEQEPNVEETPGAQENEPVAEESVPADEEMAPETEDLTIIAEAEDSETEEDDVPAVEETPAETEDDAPAAEETPAETEADAPAVEETPAETEDDVPEVEETPAETEDDEPATEETPAETEDDEPAAEETPAETEADAPAVEETPVETEAEAPVDETMVSAEEDAVEAGEDATLIEEEAPIAETEDTQEEGAEQTDEPADAAAEQAADDEAAQAEPDEAGDQETDDALIEESVVYSEVVSNEASADVAAGTMKYTATGYTGTYNGQAHGITVKVTEPASGATVMYGTAAGTYDQTELTYTDAGTHTVYYQITADGYNTVTGSAKVTINKKTVGLSWGVSEFTYDGQSHAPEAKATGVVAGDTCTVTVKGAAKDVGSYTATASKLSDSTNYALPTANTCAFKINVLTVSKLDVTLSATVFTYDKTAKKPTVKSVKANGLTVPASEYTVSYANNTNAGIATVKITDKSGGNFTINGTKAFTIDPAVVNAPTITLSATSFTYDGAAKKPTVKSVMAGTVAIPASEYTVTYLNNINAGTATVKITDKSGGNYTVNGTIKFKIEPKKVTSPTITLSPTSYTYDGTAKKPLVRTVKDGTKTIPDNEYLISYTNNIKAGTATVKISDRSGGNYTVSGSQTFTIKEAAAPKYTITLSATSFVYDGTAKKPTVKSVKLGSTVIPASEYTVSYTNNINAGTATVKITDKAGGEYNVSGTKAFEIKPKPLTSPTITLSETSYTYDGAAKKPKVTLKDGTKTIPASEYTVTYLNNVNAGKATVSITDKSGGNYEVKGTKTFTIAAKKVTAPTITLAGGNLVYDGAAKKPVVKSVKDGSKVIPESEYKISYSGNIKAGTATVKIADRSGGNYIVSGSTTFTITPKTVSLAWTNVKLTYNQKSQGPKATATNLVSGDTCTVTVTGAQTNAGSYTATATKLSNANYQLPAANTRAFTIAAKTENKPTIVLSENRFTYDGSEFQPTVTSVKSGSVVIPASEYTVSYADNIKPGTATVTITDVTGGNYTVNGKITFTIDKKQGTFENDLYTYKLEGNVCTIISYLGNENNVSIPEEMDAIPVTIIGESAFIGKGLSTVTIPKTVTRIEDNAFSGCANLTTVTVSDNVTKIGKRAFYNCGKLANMKIAN